jgi:hypothetical protein
MDFPSGKHHGRSRAPREQRGSANAYLYPLFFFPIVLRAS